MTVCTIVGSFSGGKNLAALGATTVDQCAAGTSAHAGTESVLHVTTTVVRLECPLHSYAPGFWPCKSTAPHESSFSNVHTPRERVKPPYHTGYPQSYSRYPHFSTSPIVDKLADFPTPLKNQRYRPLSYPQFVPMLSTNYTFVIQNPMFSTR